MFQPTHGLSLTPEHNAWRDMKYRCTNPRSPAWEHYGGRGIRVCTRWMDSFMLFYLDMGPKLPGQQLDRRDCNKGYDNLNCRWTDQATNHRNTRISRRWHIHGIVYDSSRLAGRAWEVTHKRIMDWCHDPSQPDCFSRKLYPEYETSPEDRFDVDFNS